jgi:integrase
MPTTQTVAEAMDAYLSAVGDSRSSNTAKAYRQALQIFGQVLLEHQFDLGSPPIDLPVEAIAWFADALRAYSQATERLYPSATMGFYEYLEGSGLDETNLPRLRQILKRRARRPGQRLPQFPREAIEKVLEHAERLSSAPVESDLDRLRNLRDRAFLLALADTGLRVHEACRMRRGDLDWNEGKAVLIRKGDKQAAQVGLAPFQLLRSLKGRFEHRHVTLHFTHKPLNIVFRQIAFWRSTGLGYNSHGHGFLFSFPLAGCRRKIPSLSVSGYPA